MLIQLIGEKAESCSIILSFLQIFFNNLHKNTNNESLFNHKVEGSHIYKEGMDILRLNSLLNIRLILYLIFPRKLLL